MKLPIAYRRYSQTAKWLYLWQKICSKVFPSPECSLTNSYKCFFDEQYLSAVNDCCEFLNISLSDFIYNFSQHSEWSNSLWNSSNKNPGVFHQRLDEYGDLHVVANCVSSFSIRYTYETLFVFLKRRKIQGEKNIVLDFGCCNGHLSFSFLQQGLIDKLVLTDLPTKATELIKFRIEKYALSDRVQWFDVSYYVPGNSEFNVIFCLDVLEHLLNPSNILSTKLSPALKKSGLLFLQAPWGGNVPSHLDEAILDFYKGKGRKFLNQKFKRLWMMTAMDISGVWMKKK